jgi:enterochelin esterase-like enzyme
MKEVKSYEKNNRSMKTGLLLLVLLCTISAPTKIYAQGPSGGGRSGLEWIDPVTEAPAGTAYHLFPTPSRGPNTQASYLIYLPPSYKTSNSSRYPVIYWLHGGRGSQREGGWMIQQMDSAIKAGLMPEVIVVLVQGLPTVRYVDTKDGTRPVEKVIIHDLIPHIDSNFRTIQDRESRAIEGMSMGGFGALRLGFKYPGLFGIVSALAPSITEMKDEPEEVQENFGFDENYYEINGPWAIVKENAGIIRNNTKVRLLVGDKDKLMGPVTKYHLLLDSLGIQHQFEVIAGAQHMYNQIIIMAKFNTFSFWANAFKK